MTEVEKLIILGKLDSHISYLSRHTYVRNLQLDAKDLVQEGQLKVLEIIQDRTDLRVKDLIALCVRSLNNFYNALIRKSRYGKREAVLIDLDEAFGIADKQRLEDIYLNFQISQLRELYNDDEVKVMECLMSPPIELVEIVMSKPMPIYSKAEVKITRTVLAKFLGYTKKELRIIMEGMREKAIPVFSLQS